MTVEYFSRPRGSRRSRFGLPARGRRREIWLLRAMVAVAALLWLAPDPTRGVVLVVPIDRQVVAAADAEIRMLDSVRSARVEAVVIRLSALNLTPARADRWQLALERVQAMGKPLAVAIEEDADLGMLALAQPADRIFGLSTTPMLDEPAPDARQAKLAGLAEAGVSTREALYRAWLHRALVESPRMVARHGDAASERLREAELHSLHDARRLGLIDGIGAFESAAEWAAGAAGFETGAYRRITVVPR